MRGFLEREIANDKGQRVSVELQTPDFGERLGSGIVAHALVFSDHGRVTRNNALPGEAAKASIASIGAGLRMSLAPHYNLRIDAAHITHGSAANPRSADSVHFSVGIAY